MATALEQLKVLAWRYGKPSDPNGPQCGFHWQVNRAVEYPKFVKAQRACIAAIERFVKKLEV